MFRDIYQAQNVDRSSKNIRIHVSDVLSDSLSDAEKLMLCCCWSLPRCLWVCAEHRQYLPVSLLCTVAQPKDRPHIIWRPPVSMSGSKQRFLHGSGTRTQFFKAPSYSSSVSRAMQTLRLIDSGPLPDHSHMKHDSDSLTNALTARSCC